jgi:hypothetical protein
MAQASREKRIEREIKQEIASANRDRMILNDINRLERVETRIQAAPGNPTVPFIREDMLRMYDVRKLNEFNDAAFRDAMAALERIEEEDTSKFAGLLSSFQAEIARLGFTGADFNDLLAYVRELRNEHNSLVFENDALYRQN